jgi:hypothetical protein
MLINKMTLPSNLISAILTFMSKQQIYILLPMIKARHNLSNKLLGKFEEYFSKVDIYRIKIYHKGYAEPYTMYYLDKEHTKWSKFIHNSIRCETIKKRYPVGSNEHVLAVQGSKIRIFKEESEPDTDN